MNDHVKEVMKVACGKTFVMLVDGQLEYILNNLASVLHLPGEVVELGCNVGMTSSYLQRLINRYNAWTLNVVSPTPDKKLYVYDSFEGLPPKTIEDGATPCDKGASAVSVEMFKQTFKDAGLSLPVMNKGFFGDLSDDKYPNEICFAFFDGDFYSSIIDSFKKVYAKMTPGGIILVHDYKWQNFPGVHKACEDFLKDKPEKMSQDMFGIGKMVKA
jgi:O-methyltransferase